MPALELAGRHEWLLLWEAGVADDYGQLKRSARFIALQCLWQEKRGQGVDAKGNVVAYDGTIHLNRDVPLGSVLWRGSYDDLLAELQGTGTGSDLSPTEDLMEVVTKLRDMDLRGRVVARGYGFRRLKDSLPTSS